MKAIFSHTIVHTLAAFLATGLLLLFLSGCAAPQDDANGNGANIETSEPSSPSAAPTTPAPSNDPSSADAPSGTSDDTATIPGFATVAPAPDSPLGSDVADMTIPHGTGQHVEYARGQVEGNRYVNESMGLAFDIPEGFSPTDSNLATAEMAYADQEQGEAVVVTYGCDTDDVPAAMAVSSNYMTAQQQEAEGFFTSCELRKVSIAGQPSYAILAQYASTGLLQLMGYYENNGHVMLIQVIAPSEEMLAEVLAGFQKA